MTLMLIQLTEESELSGDVINRIHEAESTLLSEFKGLSP
jgi:hypothetical protein